jgi:hypothetical protein
MKFGKVLMEKQERIQLEITFLGKKVESKI